ncbi:MAG TPA: carboxypeptidase-like regulatory domain-containing protein, partial [Thermoanaerobaculia bacterium]|nr:carboxypeptidase-like regulatory domain-containing protein [Thermoanaerobaculia bacterium]
GRLVDDEGLLLAGATVLLGRGREEQADPALGAAWGLRLLRPQRALTDNAGRFRFEGVRPGPASLLVHAPGYFDALLGDVDARPPPEPARGSTDALRADLGDLVVPRGPTIRGRVVDPEGRWLEGVRIWFGASEQLKARGYAMPDSPVWVTGPDGGFELAGLPDRGVEVRVELEGWMPVERERRLGPPHGSPLVLAMTPERSVRGLVAWRSGATIAGARVRAHVRPTRGAGFTGEPVRTDAEGGFELRGLVDGVVELWAVAEGARPGSVEVALDGGDPGGDVVVELDPGATLRGVVLGPGGRPVTDAVVGAGRIEASTRFPNGVRPDFAPWDGTTDGEGRFELKHLEPGPTRVRVQHDEHLPLSTELELEAGEREIELVLERGYEIRGTVVDEQGEPLPRARIYRMQHRADGSSGGGSTSTVTDAAGGFVLTGLEPAVYELSARRDDLGVGKARPVVIEDRSVSGVEIVVPAGVSVEGRIDGLSPQELRDAWIRASGPAILGSKSAWAFDDAGSFRLRGLTPGWWEISGYSETAGRTSTVVEVGDAPITGVVLRFARDDGTTLSGLVLRQGEPVLGAYVTLSPDSGGFRPSTRTDAGGSFRFESLPPGEVTVTATAEGGHASLTLDPEGDETIVLELEQGELELLVVDAENGGPVEGARATLVEPAGGRTSRSYGEWTSDAFGRISIDHRPGVYTLTVGHAELLRTEIEGVEIRPWERAGPLEVALERGTTLRLRVVGPDGEPLPARAAQARANHPSERTHAHGASDAEGRIELHPLPPGRIAVAVTAPGLAPSRLEVTVPQNNIVPVRLGRGGNVRVLVPELQASGELALLLASRGGVDQATRSLGSFSVIDGEGLAVALPPGEVKLLVRSPDGRGPRYQATAMVVEGEEVTVVAREAPPEPRP